MEFWKDSFKKTDLKGKRQTVWKKILYKIYLTEELFNFRKENLFFKKEWGVFTANMICDR